MDILTCTGQILHELDATKILHIYQPGYDLTQLLFAMNISMTVWSKPTESDDSYDSCVISCKDVDYLQPILQSLGQSKFYNSSSIVLAVYYGKLVLVDDLFALFWNYYLSNVLVLTTTLSVYTYYPISQGQCKYMDAVYLGVCAGGRPNESRSRSFWGCKQHSYSFANAPFVQRDDPKDLGLEVYMLKELQFRMGFQMIDRHHKYPSWGTAENGTYTMALLDLHTGYIDVLYGGITMHFEKCRLFECTYAHCIGYLNFFVPQPKKIEPWKNIFLVFTVEVWLLVLLILLVTSGVWVLLKQASYYTMLQMLLTVTQSKPKYLKQRLVFISWAFGAFLIVNYYQSRMMGYLFRPLYAEQIYTLEQLVSSDLKHGGIEIAKVYFPSNKNPTYKYINEYWINCDITAIECYTRMVVKEDFAFFKTLRFVRRQDSMNKTKNTDKLVNDIIVEMAFYLKKGSPLKERIDELVFRMWDAGLIEKWDVYRDFVRYFWVKPDEDPIDLDKLFSAFLTLGVGLLLSTCSFLVEVFLCKKH